MIEIQKAKIISCFNLTSIGLIAEIQHNLNGLPFETVLKDFNSDNYWIVKERVIHLGYLLAEEKRFDCEKKVQFAHLNIKPMDKKSEESFHERNIKKINDGIYCYYLTPNIKDNKPYIGQELIIEIKL